jgi:glucosyl-3-phosphoglycerate synthase
VSEELRPAERAQVWFERASSSWHDWPIPELLAAKGEHRISVVIPARNEAATIGEIAAAVRADLVDATGLVDELVVIDSDSTDATAEIAARSGATVHAARQIGPEFENHPGKGEALWKSLFVTAGDILVFIDGDLTGWGTHFVTGLLGPLLADPRIELVKGYYDRVLDDGTGRQATQGGRVTELVARPLLNLYWPELARVVQPLAGEWAIRRATFESLHVPTGYGVEMGSLLDVYECGGLDALAQVDLGSRAHTHQAIHDLGVMAAEILALTARRVGTRASASSQLWQFERGNQPPWNARAVPVAERPPARDVG